MVERIAKYLTGPLLVLAAAGFLASAVVHVMALGGKTFLTNPQFAALHIGIFVVFFPYVGLTSYASRISGQKFSWKQMLSGCPPWMRQFGIALFAYAILNFLLAFGNAAREPVYGPTPPRGLHPANPPPPAKVVRGFSGHWMVFYWIALSGFYSFRHAPHLLRPRKCPAGHQVSPLARFCPDCGAPLSPPLQDPATGAQTG